MLFSRHVGELAASMNEPARMTRVKLLQPQTRVSGSVGEFIEDGSRQRKRRHLYGTVLHATSHNRYVVSFDATPTLIVLEVASNSLRVEHATAALLPNIPIPSEANALEHFQEIMQEEIDENLQEQQEEEHLPEETPESEDVEEEGDNNINSMKRTEQMLLLLLLQILRVECLVTFLPKLNLHSQTMRV